MVACTLAAPVAASGGSSARTLYERALEREQALRSPDRAQPTAAEFRGVIDAYDNVVRRFPTSGYSDNALWQAGNLAWLAYQRFGDAADRDSAVRFLTRLKREYPSSSLRSGVDEILRAATNGAENTTAAAVGTVPSRDTDSTAEKAIGTSATVAKCPRIRRQPPLFSFGISNGRRFPMACVSPSRWIRRRRFEPNGSKILVACSSI